MQSDLGPRRLPVPPAETREPCPPPKLGISPDKLKPRARAIVADAELPEP